MPDISMCMNTTCPLRHQCYRHEASGTQANPIWQSYSDFKPDDQGECEHFWNVKDR